MKYRLLRFSLLSMLVMLFGGLSIAAILEASTGPSVVYTFEPARNTSNSDYTKTYDVTIDGINWSVPGNQSNAGSLRLGGKSLNGVDRVITSKDAIPYEVNYLKVNHTGVTSDNLKLNSVKVEVASDAAFENIVETVTATPEYSKDAAGSFTLSPANGSWAKGLYYRFSFNISNSQSSNYAFVLNSIEFYGVPDPRSETSVVFADGYATEGMEGTTIALPTATVKDANENTIEGAAITWSSSNEEVATINGNEINLLTQGTSVIKATYAGDETAYRGSENSYTLTVTETDKIANPYKYEFTSKIFDTDVLTKKLKNVTWTMDTDAGYFAYDATKGQQFGSKNDPATSLKLTLSDVPGTITSVKIYTSGASSTDATFGIKVGDADFKYGEATTATLTSDATADYTFTGSASGDVVISYTQTSSKAIYIKSIEIAYTEESQPEPTSFKNFSAILNNAEGTLLEESELNQGTAVNFGIAVDEEGKTIRVAADDAKAIAIVDGKYHSNHGLTNATVTIKVDGSVKVTVGNCMFGAAPTIYDGDTKVNEFERAINCYHQKPATNVTIDYYKGEATTLTIKGAGYLPYIAMESIADADVPDRAMVYFAAGEGAGLLPYGKKYEVGKEVTMPRNTTLYKEGYTLTGWSADGGTTTLAPGAKYTVSSTDDVTLTAQYQANTIALSDRTEEVTLDWQFGEANGVGVIDYQGKTGWVVTQATIGNNVVDVKMDIDATSSNSKFNNRGRNDKWAQVNSGVKLTIPSIKGASIEMQAYNEIKTTTVNGNAVTSTGSAGNWVSTTVIDSEVETAEIVLGDGSYYSYLKATLPAPEQQEEPTESVLYSWEGNADGAIQTGGTASASGGDDSEKDITNSYIRLKGANDFSTNVINIALDKALSTGDKIAITAYRNKNAVGKQTGALLKFEKGSTNASTATSENPGLEFVNINADVEGTDEYGTEPNTVTLEVPADAAGSKTITMTRAITGTNLFITKLVITTTGESGDEAGGDEWKFRDFGIDLVNILPEGKNTPEKTPEEFSVVVAEDGTQTTVEYGAANANISLKGTYWNDHGWTNTEATVKVEGPVQIDLGNCNYGEGSVTVKNAEGETVATGTLSKDNGCWSATNSNNVVSIKYTGGATTLTISYSSYLPYIGVKAIEASAVNVAYSLGEVECEGDILPTGGTFAAGDEYTIPAKNFTLYKDGYTLTGWSDGKNTYAAGDKITLSESITLTPVFTQNEVSLADRTEPVTLKWNFRRDQGAPVLNYQNKAGILVAQASIGDKTIDVAMPFTTSDGGKLNNTNNTDCAQCNNNTTFTIPSCKNAVVTMESYGGNYIFKADGKTATTVDGQSNYEAGQTLNYTIANSAETINIVMGNDAGYVRFVQVVLPVVQSAGGETFDNVDVLVEWPFDKHPAAGEDYSVTKTPDGAISIASFEILGDLSKSEKVSNPLGTGARSVDPDNGLAFITFCGESNMQLHWFVKPTKGLTLTPTQIKMYVQRFGTDKENGVVVTAKKENGEITTLGTYTARRANWTTDQEKTKFNWAEVPATLVNEVVIDLTADQQAALASGEGFHLYAVTGLGNEKFGGFADIRIAGKVDGTAASVEMFTLAAAASPEEGGTVSKYPNADEYEAGSEVTLTATENFGYDFVNWTNAAGEEVSTEAKFKYTINANETLTANFKAVETYQLALTVDGTNDYMVTISPAPTVVDGKNMYEEGTVVELTANQYEGLVTFTNWSDGETNSTKSITMSENTELTANYAQADIIAGWDFYKAGNNGRKADFFAQDNDADALNLVNTTDGTTSGWLDKSTEAGGGYENFKGAAVNWNKGAQNGDVGHYHWQTKINAEAFTNINVQFQMLYNYNAYQTYDVEYSLDGAEWTKFGNITMTGTKAPASFNKTLPEACNNKAELYIRMIADKTSNVDGSPSQNDGNTLAMFFITGTPKIVNDHTAPVLVSTVPADGATGVSASGKIVLTFDERVKVKADTKATLGTAELTPVVSGKVVTFEYKGLDYATEYNFVLAGKTVGDLTDNMIQDDITIKFTTMERPTVDKKLYDAVVENVDELLAAIAEAQSRSDKNVRYRIFIKNGEYTIPVDNAKMVAKAEGYEVPECITFINTSNLSIIGESRDGVIITNGIDKNATFAGTYGTTSKYDGIGNSDVFQLSGSDYYFQDLTIETGMDDGTGRDLAIQDKATRTIYKNTGLRGYQDTWTSNNDNGLYYFEDGYLRGRTDYMCGKGDAFFNGVELRQIYGGYAAVPSKSIKYGFTYKGCTINGEESPAVSGKKAADVDGNYTLGRPWGSGTPVALFIDTKMNVVPSAVGWNEMSGGWPKRFAEYNSTTSTGSVIDLSSRKTWWHEGGKEENPTIGEKNNPILTAEEALEAGNLHNMFGEWDPTLATEQAPIVTDVKLTGNKLSWTGSNYALLYAIVKNGEVIDFTTETTYNIGTAAGSRRAESTDQYQIRAANEMGGLNEASEVATETDGIETVNDNVNVNLNDNIYNLQGIRVNKAQKGVYIIGGRKVVIK